nr:hypothetical protein [Tanacetum cinerariifolium]
GGGSILNNMEQLHMINLPVLKNICEGPMQEIRHLEVERCPEIKEIFNGSTNIVSPILPNLKKLILVDMPQLRSILQRKVGGKLWKMMRTLEINFDAIAP